MTQITFIGAGNMARSLIAGLCLEEGGPQITVSDPDEVQLDVIRGNWPGCATSTDNISAVANADVIVLAVKPQIMQRVCEGLAGHLPEKRPLIVSVAAGFSESGMTRGLGGGLPVVRCMPNTPALVQAGMTGLYANAKVTDEQCDLAESMLRTVSMTLWFEDEEKLHAVTAVSGSGPAYFFLMMEAMQASAENLGLDTGDARLLVLQTALGAAKLALESPDSPAELRRKVTSKGGTTEAAIAQFQGAGMEAIVDKALHAAAQRSEVLSGARPTIENKG